jgi:hypothetical protein
MSTRYPQIFTTGEKLLPIDWEGDLIFNYGCYPDDLRYTKTYRPRDHLARVSTAVSGKPAGSDTMDLRMDIFHRGEGAHKKGCVQITLVSFLPNPYGLRGRSDRIQVEMKELVLVYTEGKVMVYDSENQRVHDLDEFKVVYHPIHAATLCLK